MEKLSLRDINHMYDEQFNRNMRIAKFLIKQLRDKKDIQLATRWLIRVSNIKSTVLNVKKNRNAFLSYFLQVLRDSVLATCTDSIPNTVCDPDNSLNLDGAVPFSDETKYSRKVKCGVEHPKIKYHSKWSPDHSIYTAVKPIPGKGALVYIAVSKKPGLENWDLPRFSADTQ